MKRYFMVKTTAALLGLLLLAGCSEKREPLSVTTHPKTWMDESSEGFHGKAVLASDATPCQSCHGTDFSGGSAGVSCYDCHSLFPHPEGFKNETSPNFHGKYIAASLGWNLKKCQECHGSDYSGGKAEESCLECHTEKGGPEACNTCHGSELNYAPPKDLAGNTSTTNVGVGAHQAHLQDSTYTTAYTKDCSLCHMMPVTFDDPAHIDGDQVAEVVFSEFASDSGNVSPQWSHSNATCENVYCHGAFQLQKSESSFSWVYTEDVIEGNFLTMKWTLVGTEQDSCGSCHGLPPKGHFSATTCNQCHGKVVDAEKNIINKKLHMNGRADVF